MTISEYTIIADRLSDAQSKIEKLNKRARKLGVPEVILEVVPGSEQIKKDGNDNYKTIDVVLVGEKIKLAGWHFAATIQHTGEGNIVRRVPGSDENAVDLKDYREVEPMCDHCRMLRRRNDTYIVVNDEGETKQVGSSCLRDFLGADPASALWMAQFLIDLDAEFESEYSEPGERTVSYYKIETYLGWVSASIRNSGWLSRGKARWEDAVATADDAFNVWYWMGRTPRPYEPTDEDFELGEKALEWIRSTENPMDANDYIYNLYVATKQNYITWREFGLVASLIQAYSRHMEQELKLARMKKDSSWVGEKGVRQEFTLTVESVRYIDGSFGVTALHSMVDADGNIFTWFGSGSALEVGKTYTGKATVKDHTEYKGVKQTIINRPKFQEA